MNINIPIISFNYGIEQIVCNKIEKIDTAGKDELLWIEAICNETSVVICKGETTAFNGNDNIDYDNVDYDFVEKSWFLNRNYLTHSIRKAVRQQTRIVRPKVWEEYGSGFPDTLASNLSTLLGMTTSMARLEYLKRLVALIDDLEELDTNAFMLTERIQNRMDIISGNIKEREKKHVYI